MEQPGFLIYNGAVRAYGDLFLTPDMRGFKFGDGFFETMKLVNGKLSLGQFHWERLLGSLQQLGFEVPAFLTPAWLNNVVLELAERNGHLLGARVRVTVFRGEGGIYGVVDHQPHFIIQTWRLAAAEGMSEKGLTIGIYRDAVKAADAFSAVKSSNYLGYAMAARWAEQQGLDDAILLNAAGRVADATIANVFIVHEGIVKTPPLSEGGVNGVMRRYLLGAMQAERWKVEETPVEERMLQEATEVFLTNALSGIRWVKSLSEHTFEHHLSTKLYNQSINVRLW